MAAGQHGKYRDHESRYSDGDRERSRARDPRERIGGGGAASGSDQKRSHLAGNKVVDREPGELSSGSGSDDTEAPAARDRANWMPKPENVDSAAASKKRKFSPVIWDSDDDKRSRTVNSRSKNGRLEPVAALPPPPPLPDGYVPTEIVRETSEHALPLNTKVLVDSPSLRWGDDQEPGQLDEEDYMRAPNISTSRWADGNNALEDDEVDTETYENEIMPRKRGSTALPNPVDLRSRRKAPSPELGEVLREESVEAASKSSGSEGDQRDGREEVEVDENEYMDVEIAGEGATDVAIDHLSDTDSKDKDEDGSIRTPTGKPQRSINMFHGCKKVDEFERLNKIDEGTYGVVYRARDKQKGEIVALKKVKMEKEREGFPLTSLREINILLSFHHPSIVDVKEVVVGSSLDSIFMVMEYMEHDLKGLMETMKQPFSQSEVKCLMLQLLDGVKYLHDNWVLHRDLKTSNILLNNRGELKICDFGLSRQYGIPLKPYTHLVVTLWYRAPELLLGAKEYSTAIDMWSLGCIMAELLAKEPLFCGKTEFDQLDKIFRTLGTPNEKIWPGFLKLPGVKVNFVKQPFNKLREKFPPTSFSGRPTLSEAGFDLLNKLLTYDPEKRISADAALKHDWFREVPMPKSKDFMPTFPAQHAQDRRLRRIMKSPDPLEEQRRKELQQGDLGTGSLFG